MPMTLVELMQRIDEKRTAGYHARVELTLAYRKEPEPKGPKEWRPTPRQGTWILSTGIHLEYSSGTDPRRRVPTYEGPTIRPLLERMVEFFNSGPMRIYTPANSYSIYGIYELAEKIELGEIPC